MPALHSISAITLFTADMARSVDFYRQLGFTLKFGGAGAPFTSFYIGRQFLNIALSDQPVAGHWGRAIFYTEEVDALYRHLVGQGLTPEFAPRDAPWGERYFHLRDPDGHELSFAWPLPDSE